VPVLALAQLNRAVEARAGKVPQLSDLRESGEIEQAADAVLFFHRPDYYDPEDRPGEADIIIAKQRNGPLGVVPVAFDGPTTTFRSLSRYEAPEGY
jgi:replicative DNA helicase